MSPVIHPLIFSIVNSQYCRLVGRELTISAKVNWEESRTSNAQSTGAEFRGLLIKTDNSLNEQFNYKKQNHRKEKN